MSAMVRKIFITRAVERRWARYGEYVRFFFLIKYCSTGVVLRKTIIFRNVQSAYKIEDWYRSILIVSVKAKYQSAILERQFLMWEGMVYMDW